MKWTVERVTFWRQRGIFFTLMFFVFTHEIAAGIASLLMWALTRGYPHCGLRCDAAGSILVLLFLPVGVIGADWLLRKVLPWYLK